MTSVLRVENVRSLSANGLGRMSGKTAKIAPSGGQASAIVKPWDLSFLEAATELTRDLPEQHPIAGT